MADYTFLQDGWDVLALDPNYEGMCPCAHIEVSGQKLQLHCWRVDQEHDGCGIHYEGEQGRKVARLIKPLLDEMNWYGEWTIWEGFR